MPCEVGFCWDTLVLILFKINGHRMVKNSVIPCGLSENNCSEINASPLVQGPVGAFLAGSIL
jgi:hypothetical protein